MNHRYLTLAFLACSFFASAQVPTLLRDINANGGANVSSITCVDGLVYFRANDDVHGNEVWVSDGTSEGTVLLKDINPGLNSSYPVSFLNWNDRVYFAADDGNGYALWSTDGTEVGTQFELAVDNVQDLEFSSRFTVYNNMVIFNGRTEALGAELWVSNGTVDGTQLVKDIYPGSIGSGPREFTEYNGLLYFAATSPDLDEELWVTDGTEAGTTLVKDIDEASGSGAPRDLAVMNGLLYFKGDDGYAHGSELWVTDGTADGTVMVLDIVPGGNESLPQDLVAFNNELWFSAYTGGTANLWHSDGTAEGTLMLALGSAEYSSPAYLCAQGDKLYFTAFIGGSDEQLWVSDGSTAGTTQIVYPGPQLNGALYPADGITGCGDYIFFAASYDAAVGAEPYTLLSPVGIVEQALADLDRIYPNPSTGRLFMADPPANGRLQLYAADGSLALERSLRDMDISALPTGLYLARVAATDGSVVHVQPLVKE